MSAVSNEFSKTFLSAPQANPSNSGKGKKGNYKRPYDKTKASLHGKPEQYRKFPCNR